MRQPSVVVSLQGTMASAHTRIHSNTTMLGWNINVHRQQDEGTVPPTFGAAQGTFLAAWQTGLGGLDWIYELVKQGKAIDLGGNGYPYEFTAMAEHLTDALEQPPHANATWVAGERDILPLGHPGKTVVDGEAIRACRRDEWLMIRAWDES